MFSEVRSQTLTSMIFRAKTVCEAKVVNLEFYSCFTYVFILHFTSFSQKYTLKYLLTIK